MNSKEFHITIYSISRFIIAFIAILLPLGLLTDRLPKTVNGVIFILGFAAALILIFFVACWIARAKAKVIFTEEAFLHIWEKRFFLSFEKDIEIPWSKVDDYVFMPDRFFDSFIINLIPDGRYKITKISILPEDDFEKLHAEFPLWANRCLKQNAPEGEAREIKKSGGFYATKEFRWIVYILSAGFICLVAAASIFSDRGTNWGGLGVIGCALVFYLLMIRRR